MLEFTVGWSQIESNQIHIEHDFSPNKEPNLKYYLYNYFENSIEQ